MTNRLRTKGTSEGLSIHGLKSGVFWPSALPTEINHDVKVVGFDPNPKNSMSHIHDLMKNLRPINLV